MWLFDRNDRISEETRRRICIDLMTKIQEKYNEIERKVDKLNNQVHEKIPIFEKFIELREKVTNLDNEQDELLEFLHGDGVQNTMNFSKAIMNYYKKSQIIENYNLIKNTFNSQHFNYVHELQIDMSNDCIEFKKNGYHFDKEYDPVFICENSLANFIEELKKILSDD